MTRGNTERAVREAAAVADDHIKFLRKHGLSNRDQVEEKSIQTALAYMEEIEGISVNEESLRIYMNQRILVDDGPVVPRKPVKRPKFTIEIHHKRREQLPQWVLDNPDFTIKSTFQKPMGPISQGDATRAMVERARRKMDEGMTAKEAAWDTAALLRAKLGKDSQGRDNASKLYKDRRAGIFRGKWCPADKPGEGLYRTILSGLRHKKGRTMKPIPGHR